MAAMSKLEELGERVDRLLRQHVELRDACEALSKERDSLRSRLNAARQRIDALLDRLPDESLAAPPHRLEPTTTLAEPGA